MTKRGGGGSEASLKVNRIGKRLDSQGIGTIIRRANQKIGMARHRWGQLVRGGCAGPQRHVSLQCGSYRYRCWTSRTQLHSGYSPRQRIELDTGEEQNAVTQ